MGECPGLRVTGHIGQHFLTHVNVNKSFPQKRGREPAEHQTSYPKFSYANEIALQEVWVPPGGLSSTPKDFYRTDHSIRLKSPLGDSIYLVGDDQDMLKRMGV